MPLFRQKPCALDIQLYVLIRGIRRTEFADDFTVLLQCPVICGGGVGCGDDIVDGAKAGADAVACAAVLHYKKETVQELKDELRAGGVEVRRV